jgi:ribosomal protein S18 acetylase RimI-like enzyme
MVLLHTFYLEHLGPPAGPAMTPPMLNLAISTKPLAIDDYLALFQEVGGPVGWDGRTRMARADLADFLAKPTTQIFVLSVDGVPSGFCEFSRDDAPESEIVYFGLVPSAQGQKLGPYLLDHALRAHWTQHAPHRVWLHTDEWDGPRAVDTYKRAGFRVFGERKLDEDATYRDYRAARDAITAGLPDA